MNTYSNRRGHGLQLRLGHHATRSPDSPTVWHRATRPGWFRPTACPTTCLPMPKPPLGAASRPSSPVLVARPTCRACWRPRPRCRCWACRWPAKHLSGRGFAAQHRANAQGHSGGHLCHWRGRCGQCRAVCGGHAGQLTTSCCAPSWKTFAPNKPRWHAA